MTNDSFKGNISARLANLQREMNAAGMGDPRDKHITALRVENERLRAALEKAAAWLPREASDWEFVQEALGRSNCH